jgi:hypothetical protein
MPELASIKTFGWRIGIHVLSGEFIHFAPLDTTFNHLPVARSIKNFSRLRLPISTVSSSDHEIFPSRADNGMCPCRLCEPDRIEPIP